jgi:glycerol uptake facilitator-like aquaporin
MAEATGVYFYVFPGIAAIAQFTVNASPESPLPVPFFSNILQVGFAFAMGIAFAIITCAPVSGGHFNPAITISLAIWQGITHLFPQL